MPTPSPVEQQRKSTFMQNMGRAARTRAAGFMMTGGTTFSSLNNTQDFEGYGASQAENRENIDTRPVAPPIPDQDTNQEWSPFDGAGDAFLPESKPPEGANDFLVDPVTGDERGGESSRSGGLAQGVENEAMRYAEKKAIAAVAGSVTGGTGALAADAIMQGMDQLGIDPVQAGKDLVLFEQLNPFVDPIGFGWVNIKMFVGSFLLDDKSKLIPGLTWSIKDILPVMILHAFVLLIDAVLITIIFIFGALVLLLLYGVYRFYEDPIGFAQELLSASSIFAPLAPLFRSFLPL